MSQAPAPVPAPAGYRLPSADEAMKALLRRGWQVFLVMTAVSWAVGLAWHLAGDGSSAGGLAAGLLQALLGIVVGGLCALAYLMPNGVRLNRRMLARWQAHDHAWYRAAYPDRVNAMGGVICRHCGGDQVVVRKTMNEVVLGRHTCARCGSVLYYSHDSACEAGSGGPGGR